MDEQGTDEPEREPPDAALAAQLVDALNRYGKSVHSDDPGPPAAALDLARNLGDVDAVVQSLPVIWYAVLHEDRAVCEVLLERGADPNPALEVAMEGYFFVQGGDEELDRTTKAEILGLVLRHGARPSERQLEQLRGDPQPPWRELLRGAGSPEAD